MGEGNQVRGRLPVVSLAVMDLPTVDGVSVDWSRVDWQGVSGARLAVLIELACRDGARADVPQGVLVEAVAAGDRVAAWAKSTQLLGSREVVARHCRPDRPPDPDPKVAASQRGIARSLGERSAITELALACRASEHVMRQLVDDAEHLLSRFPATFDALHSGRVSWSKCRPSPGPWPACRTTSPSWWRPGRWSSPGR